MRWNLNRRSFNSISGYRVWFLETVIPSTPLLPAYVSGKRLLWQHRFCRLSLMGSGGSDITVLSPAFSPGCSGISFRSTLMISPCPIDSRSENTCCFLGTITDGWWTLGSVDPWFEIYSLQRFWLVFVVEFGRTFSLTPAEDDVTFWWMSD